MKYFLGRILTLALLPACAALPLSVMGQGSADTRPEARKMSGLQAEALELKLFKVSQSLLQDPQNPELLLQKGAHLSELGRLQAAFEVFEQLRQNFPNHPAPYANLASIYARQGRLEDARQMLIKADALQGNRYQTQLSLASVNLELALAALNRANQLKPGDKATEAKLRMLEKYLAESSKTPFQALEPDRTRGAETITPKWPEGKLSRSAVNASSRQARDRLLLGAIDTDEAPRAEGKPASDTPGTSGVSVAVRQEDPRKAEVLKAVETWVAVWGKRSFDEFSMLYSSKFEPSEGITREAWARKKQSTMEKAKFIQVDLTIRSVAFSDDKATVILNQKYSSDRYSVRDRKELKLIQEDGRWKILSERVLK